MPAVFDPHGSARVSDPVTYSSGVYTSPHAREEPVAGWEGGPTGITVAVAGVIVGKLLDDNTDRTFGVSAGINPLRFKSITESGTTATGLVVVRG
jgi:hypothetical protein